MITDISITISYISYIIYIYCSMAISASIYYFILNFCQKVKKQQLKLKM